ncbi:hypothetical protein IMG5_103290 [Ichthyophthirius multifiliis]|uniref:Uncharacterized protein n=1 Tax=Ichthyophthirius multifiliis TaxID=5932 RepID=G0QST3_ICHMU|nr:hypothetical protein IMG5_103290 [Ichthyophthirius multifiliis]EGR31728.1 hypothetical protein IMG5_103290 [Ichthyophthirius multifiliis]|eukprot:XP_004035214.1 hypothetical protein IMG5_103290 [Ichthyophthirius multifiliis]
METIQTQQEYSIDFLQEEFKLLKQLIKQSKQGTSKVINFKTPQDLENHIDLNIPQQPTSDQQILDFLQKVGDLSVKTSSVHFYNNLFGGINEYSLSADYLTSTLNGTIGNMETSSLYRKMENILFKTIAQKYLKWESFSGIFSSGGSQANFYGIELAKYWKFPEKKYTCIQNLPEIRIFTSELGHYSLEKGSILMGFGQDAIIKVQSDKQGRIIPEELEKEIQNCIKQNYTPLILNLTCGTTVYGVIDKINECVQIGKKYNMWIHIDGCWGGHMLFLDEIFQKNSLVSTCDSFAWDAHKLLNVPQQCSMLITQHTDILEQTNGVEQGFFDTEDGEYKENNLDQVDQMNQYSKHVDVLKIWVYWMHYGSNGIEKLIRDAIDTAQYFSSLVKQHKNFELILEPEYVSVSFFYFPDSFLKRKEKEYDNENFWNELHKIPPIIKGKMVEEGCMMVAYQKQDQKQYKKKNFFRIIFTVDKGKEDAKYAFQQIHRLGQNL